MSRARPSAGFLLLFMISSLAAGCAPEPGADEALAASSIHAGPPVRLLYAKATRNGCERCASFSGVVEVANIAYEKDVTVIWRVRDESGSLGEWTETPATYLGPLDQGRELWSFGGVGGAGETELKVRYRVAGQEHVDDGGGRTYRGVIGYTFPNGVVGVDAPLGAGVDVLLVAARASRPWDETLGPNASTFLAEVLVRNLTYHKQVTLVYSTDGWSTVMTAPGHHSYGGGAMGETWLVLATLPPGARALEFAVASTQDGVTRWDNNFGRNFSCVLDPEAPRGSSSIEWDCSGAAFLP